MVIFAEVIHTVNAPVGSPFWIAKCKLASPSVTKDSLSFPAGVSGMSPAKIAALRIWLCCFPSQPFGWDRTKSICPLTESQRSAPLACVSLMYIEAHSKRYIKKSENTSTTVLFNGRGGILLVTSCPAPGASRERRCSLNLVICVCRKVIERWTS